MPSSTGIEWTDTTWNPVTGCTRVSTGCDYCYAATLSHRLLGKVYRSRAPVVDTDFARHDPFAVRLWPERLEQPLNWQEPRLVFVNSMSDVFHSDIPDDYLRDMFAVMILASWHTFQVLTKRPGRAARFLERNPDILDGAELPSHIWIGTSIENQDVAYRANHLRDVPARIRFLSCEPLLGPLRIDLTDIHWVIAGGESGPQRRPMKEEWALQIRDLCLESRVPFFFKQWGGRTPKAGGRQLAGELWDEMPPHEAISQ